MTDNSSANLPPGTKIVTRFAPSPTGRLHIGHAYSALFAALQARAAGGTFILRIEDIDPGRCRPTFEQGIYEDLRWLGLEWPTPVRRQSDYMDDYKDALSRLLEKDLLYPCFCSRKDVQDEVARAGVAPHGPEGVLYPGTCRHLGEAEREQRMRDGQSYAFRLNLDAAIEYLKRKNQWPLTWHDVTRGVQTATPEILGDVVLARKDVSTSYHLSVTLDDHLQGVTMVTRGEDLFYATHLHRLLQALLDLDVPQWYHHQLLLDENGKRFAKRNDSVTLQYLREEEKKTPADIIRMVGLSFCMMLMVLGFGLAAPAHAEPAHAEPVQDSPLQDAPLDAEPPDLQAKITDQVVRSPYKRYVTFSLENDSIGGGGTDRNYTNGARISYLNVNAQVPDLIDDVAEAIPTFGINETTSIFWTLGQNLYTPADITIAAPQPDDRPWAAWLYGAAGLVTLEDNHVDELELTLGVVGPAALGEWAQDTVHDILEVDTPRGWDNQLKNEPGIMVSWRRRWPGVYDSRIGPLYMAFEPNMNLTLGNIYTYAGAGALVRFTPYNTRFQDPPPFVRPAMPGTGYFEGPHDGMGWYLFAGVDGRAIARNIFLDGNTFRDSPSVDKKPFVADVTAGVAFTFERVRISYSTVYRTREFDGQDDGDLFGVVGVTWRY